MTLTQEEESIIKAEIAVRKANFNLANEENAMGVAIRTEFSEIDARLRLEHKASLAVLRETKTSAETALRTLLE